MCAVKVPDKSVSQLVNCLSKVKTTRDMGRQGQPKPPYERGKVHEALLIAEEILENDCPWQSVSQFSLEIFAWTGYPSSRG